MGGWATTRRVWGCPVTRRVLAWGRAPAVLAGATLVIAGVLKAGQPAEFGRLIQGYRLLPALAVPALAVVLPWLEVAAGALLVGRRLALGAATLATGLAAGFLLAGLSAVARGLHPLCGCFGVHSGELGALTLAIEAAVLACAALALRAEWRAARAFCGERAAAAPASRTTSGTPAPPESRR